MILIAAAALAAVNPLTFFNGTTHGTGTIRILFKGTQALHAISHGRPDGHGGIYLDQNVTQGKEGAKARHWDLRPTSASGLGGTLTPDASGPVIGRISSRTLILAYPMKDSLRAAQTLILQPGGRVLLNHMTVKKFGVTVATIDERIIRN